MCKRLTFIIYSVFAVVSFVVAPRVEAVSSTLLISTVQTSSAGSQTEELVELFNSSGLAVDVTGWRVEYLSAAGNVSSPALATLSGGVPAGGSLLLARQGYRPDANLHFTNGLADAGGHVRIRDNTGVVVDMVGWGTAIQPEAQAAPAPSPGKWLDRKATLAGLLIDTDNNAADFALSGELVASAQNVAPTSGATNPPSSTGCEAIVLSEILPNPAGTDTGHEFIELYNPTSGAVSLGGCSLSVGSKSFALPADNLQAGEYRALYDAVTGLTLPNAAGGVVELASPTTEQAVQYAPSLGNNEAWAHIGGSWQATTLPTPGAPNQIQTVAAKTTTGGDIELTPCTAGKYRNPETNRCKNVESDDGLIPCKVGQIRNASTNRCVSAVTASAASSLIPCKAGQERNPQTNRCRSVQAASSVLKPCDAGEERNPETNRCRKAAGAAKSQTGGTTATTAGDASKGRANYLIMGGVAAAALGYGVYEYRQDLKGRLLSIKARLFPEQAGK